MSPRTFQPLRGWGLLLGGLCLSALAGCASLGLEPAEEDEAAPLSSSAVASSAAASAPADQGQVPRLKIVAPDALRALLEKHLDLARALALPEAASLDRGEWARLTGTVPEQTRTLARTLGYFQPQIKLHAEQMSGSIDELISLEGSAVQSLGQPYTLVVVEVAPGPQARVRTMELQVQGELAQLSEHQDAAATELRQALEQDWPLPQGAPFDNSRWSSAKSDVIGRMRAAGYAQASWHSTAAEVSPEQATVNIQVVLDSGPLFRAGDIEVEGLVREELAPAQALAGWHRGDALTEARLVEYQERLLKTGLFEQVAVGLDPNPAQAQAARVLVKVREATLHTATFAVGMTTDSGPHASVEHTYRRVLGLPIIARNKLVWAKNTQSIDGELSSHRDGKFNRNLIGLVVERTADSTEVSLSQRWRLGRAHDSTSNEWLSFIQAERARECDQVSGSSSFECTQLRALTLNRHVIWRELDSVILPTTGYALQMQAGAGLADDGLNQRGPFARLYSRWIGYRPLGLAWYGQARVELGRVIKSADLAVPDSQLFRAGGDESVRGYSWRSLAPSNSSGTLQGGTTLFTASAEIARPFSLTMPAVWWAAFVDAGRAADDWRSLNPALGYGLGLRWRSPVGPLKVDWAWGREVHRARLHISIGLAF